MKWCWHKWGTWSIPTDSYDGKYQHSICEKCGTITSKKLKYDGSTPSIVLYRKFKEWFNKNDHKDINLFDEM